MKVELDLYLEYSKSTYFERTSGDCAAFIASVAREARVWMVASDSNACPNKTALTCVGSYISYRYSTPLSHECIKASVADGRSLGSGFMR